LRPAAPSPAGSARSSSPRRARPRPRTPSGGSGDPARPDRPPPRRVTTLPPPPRRFTAVIFDMDGVLVDSEPMHLDAMRRVLTPYGVAYTDRENAEFFGFTDPEVFGILRARYGLAPEPLELTRRRTELLVEFTRKGTVPMPGVPDVPRALHGRGYRLAVASSSAPVVIRATVEALGLASLFDALASGLDVVRGMPAPDLLVQPPQRLRLP